MAYIIQKKLCAPKAAINNMFSLGYFQCVQREQKWADTISKFGLENLQSKAISHSQKI